jgi:hypothetical protein
MWREKVDQHNTGTGTVSLLQAAGSGEPFVMN